MGSPIDRCRSDRFRSSLAAQRLGPGPEPSVTRAGFRAPHRDAIALSKAGLAWTPGVAVCRYRPNACGVIAVQLTCSKSGRLNDGMSSSLSGAQATPKWDAGGPAARKATFAAGALRAAEAPHSARSEVVNDTEIE